jgi:hypothetical protein
VSTDLNVVALAPWNATPSDVRMLMPALEHAPLPVGLLTRAWKYRALGVPRNSSIVHATSMAGPYGGGVSGAVHSVAMHDLLWRDDINEPTARGIRFHEDRLALLRDRKDVRIFTSSPGLKEQLVDDGFESERIHPVRLGVDDDGDCTRQMRSWCVNCCNNTACRVRITLYVGTREPRKNLERLISGPSRGTGRRCRTGTAGPGGFAGLGQR